MNNFCSCGFAIHSPRIFCFDGFSVTLRGGLDSQLVPYLKDWVTTKKTTVQLQETPLNVDKSCIVTIPSLDEPGCIVIPDPSQSTPYTYVGIGAGAGIVGILIFIVIIAVVIAIVRRRRARRLIIQ